MRSVAQQEKQRQARAARAQIEQLLNFNGWPWSPRLSGYVDMLVILGDD